MRNPQTGLWPTGSNWRPSRIARTASEKHVQGAMPIEARRSKGGASYFGGAYKAVTNIFGVREENTARDRVALGAEEKLDQKLQQYQIYKRDHLGKKIYDEDGNPVLEARAFKVPPSIRSLRLQMLSIRLNAHHWEWSYSRWLKNKEMFDTPSMTPFLHNAEFDRPVAEGAAWRADGGSSRQTNMRISSIPGRGGGMTLIHVH